MPRDTEPISSQREPERPKLPIGPDGMETLPYWVKVSREYDDMLIKHGFTKTDREIIIHVIRREGIEDGCFAGLRDMAKYTRTHIDYVKHRLKYLVNRGVIIRVKRPGKTSILRMADKLKWFEMNPPYSRNAPTPPAEETREEVKRKIRTDLWQRIWAIPGGNAAPRKPFERMMDKNIDVFEAVVTEMENRVKRGLPENRSKYGPDALEEVKSFVGLFIHTFGIWEKSNRKKP